MKISNDLKQVQSIQHTRANSESKVSFDHLVQSQTLKMKQQEIQQLMVKITEQGNKLARYRTFRELVKFKKLVKGFLEETVYQGYDLDKNHHFSLEGHSRQLTLVKEIDEKLVELTDALMNQEKKTVDLLGLIGEIKGLLINLYI
ncbi:YaaR family protein [Ornithinibacillus sp. 4-3]|uniref:YaaR family protein n=1 Tax=Ornithinibacillus sp. 4-3 TaxID=3231488 RepID=A0AB39HRI9_9BACI